MNEGERQPEGTTTNATDGHNSDSSSLHSPPPPPVPATDPKLHDPAAGSDEQVTSPTLAVRLEDVSQVSPQAALRLLSSGVEALVNMTGDIPPTPPPHSPTLPHMRGMEAEKQSIVRSNSEKNLARLAQRNSASASPMPGRSPLQQACAAPITQGEGSTPTPTAQAIDGVHLRAPITMPNPPPQTPPPSNSSGSGSGSGFSSQPQTPPLQSAQLAPYIIVGDNSQPLNQQHSAITRKFYCRIPPPISITDYLLRVHRYCPMSTGVYLAASLYIHRLAVLERAIVVTKRNAHRLLLAGLRVAMKALEDLSYPHGRFARVGGVSEKELARLEISFCFLTGFELAVSGGMLTRHWDLLRRGAEGWNVWDEELQQEHEGNVERFVVQLGNPPGGDNVTAEA
ncbi:cyclin-domain-containing protein [Chaetomium sp. MPI-SDFR-AT-0129]|nr:cyclin-domain-containing protein [Chaetomium sp. MPI-SDFR-AT-0129]